MLRVQIQFVSNHTKAFLVSSISKCSVFAMSIRINIVEQIQTSKFLSLFVFSFDQMTYCERYKSAFYLLIKY